MPAFAAVSLPKADLTAVAFTPSSINSQGVATYLTGDAIFDAKSRLTMSVTLPKNNGSVVRVKQKVVIPIMDTVDTTLKVGEAYASIDIVLPKTSSLVVRKDLQSYVEALIADAVTTAAVENFEAAY